MSLPVYDFRNDIRNVLVTPKIRSRFMQLEPGTYAEPHSHDLGHEIFIVMQGSAIFEIDGKAGEVRPGQMCVALANQLHSIQVTSQEPMIMYLSVTPHIIPTHTSWTDNGEKQPYRYGPPGAYDQPVPKETIQELAERVTKATSELYEAARITAELGNELPISIKTVIEDGDKESALKIRETLLESLLPLYELADKLAYDWNNFSPAVEDSMK